jgi:hypothetical protein
VESRAASISTHSPDPFVRLRIWPRPRSSSSQCGHYHAGAFEASCHESHSANTGCSIHRKATPAPRRAARGASGVHAER